jgi:hypothetical protein
MAVPRNRRIRWRNEFSARQSTIKGDQMPDVITLLETATLDALGADVEEAKQAAS